STDTAGVITKTVPIRIEKGLTRRVAAGRASAQKVEARLKSKGEAALLAALPTAEYRLSLLELADAGEINPDRVDFETALTEADEMVAALGKGQDPLASRRGDFRKAYRSEVDRTLQPYRIFVP